MLNIFFRSFAILAAVLLLGGCRQKPSNPSPDMLPDQPKSDTTAQSVQLQDTVKRKLLVVELSGTPHERGIQHGTQLKKEILELWEKRQHSLAKETGMDAGKFVDLFMKKTNFIPAMKKHTPDLLEEVKGLSEATGIDFNSMLFYQLGDELWANMGDLLAADHCSSLGVFKQAGQSAIVAQNMDVPSLFDGYQTLLHIKYPGSDLESYVFTFAGNIALNGMNNKAVGVCANTLSQLDYCNDGLPVACVIRKVLEMKKFEEAVTFVKTVKHASGQNYVVGGPEKVLSLECSSNKVATFVPYQNANRTFHTNHPIANDDKGKYLALLKKKNKEEPTSGDSFIRFDAMKKYLGDSAVTISVEQIKKALMSRDSEESPVCKFPRTGRAFSFGSTLMMLSPEKPELVIAPGPPVTTSYQTFSFGK